MPGQTAPNYRRTTTFSPSQATLTVDFTVSVEMSPERMHFLDGICLWWILDRQAPAPACLDAVPYEAASCTLGLTNSKALLNMIRFSETLY